MKSHKLSTHGAQRTKCGVSIPVHLAPSPIAIVWVEPDGDDGVTNCARCHADPSAPVYAYSPAAFREAGEKPAKPLPPAAPSFRVQRFSAFHVSGGGVGRALVWTKVGVAYTNRDGSMNLTLDVPIASGKLHLREDGKGPAPFPDVISRSGAPFKAVP